MHALWGCQVVKETWWEAIQDRNQLWERFQSFRDLLIRIFNFGAPFLAERFAYVAWSLWNKRNAIRTQSHYLPYSMIYSDAVDRLNEYHSCLDHHANEVPHPPLVKWQAPTKDLYKANFDGALFPDIHAVGIGVVIRDHLGQTVASLSEQTALPSTVEAVEAIACRRAITFAQEIGLRDVIVEGDSETVINLLNSKSPCLASFGHIIDDSRAIASSFRYYSFSHTKRMGNTVADKLAKLAKFCNFPQIWLEDIHHDAANFVMMDRSHC